jgi:hypothetical protein
METSVQKIKNKKVWRRIGIGFLWISFIFLIVTARDNTVFNQGLYIGQASVYLIWAIKETIAEYYRIN